MGALLAADLTGWLARRTAPLPVLLVLSGRGAPTAVPAQVRAHVVAATDDQVLATVPELSAVDDPELRAVLASTLRADLELCARHQPSPEPLTVPLLALAGQDDLVAPPAEVVRWEHRTTGPFRAKVLPGGHDFPYRQAASVAALVTRHPALRPFVDGK